MEKCDSAVEEGTWALLYHEPSGHALNESDRCPLVRGKATDVDGVD